MGEGGRTPWVETRVVERDSDLVYFPRIREIEVHPLTNVRRSRPPDPALVYYLFPANVWIMARPLSSLPTLSLRSPVTLRIHEYRLLALSLSLYPLFSSSDSPGPSPPREVSRACSFNFADRGVVFSRFSRTVETLNPGSEPCLALSVFLFLSLSPYILPALPSKDQSSVRYARARRSARNCLKIVHESRVC